MAKLQYHIGKNGPAVCEAKRGKCPLGGSSGQQTHFDSYDDASKAYAKKLSNQYGTTTTFEAAKLQKSPKYKFYNSPRITYNNRIWGGIAR